jgi:sec-independent protein translocase protein TatB
MFGVDISEMFVVAVVALLVLGPDKLRIVARHSALWIGRLRRMYVDIKNDIEREIDADGIRAQLHNETIMTDLKKHSNTIQPDDLTDQHE